MPKIEASEKRQGLHLACFRCTAVESKKNSPAQTPKMPANCESQVSRAISTPGVPEPLRDPLCEFQISGADKNGNSRQPVLRQKPMRIRSPLRFEDQRIGRLRFQRSEQRKLWGLDFRPLTLPLKRVSGKEASLRIFSSPQRSPRQTRRRRAAAQVPEAKAGGPAGQGVRRHGDLANGLLSHFVSRRARPLTRPPPYGNRRTRRVPTDSQGRRSTVRARWKIP